MESLLPKAVRNSGGANQCNIIHPKSMGRFVFASGFPSTQTIDIYVADNTYLVVSTVPTSFHLPLPNVSNPFRKSRLSASDHVPVLYLIRRRPFGVVRVRLDMVRGEKKQTKWKWKPITGNKTQSKCWCVFGQPRLNHELLRGSPAGLLTRLF